MKVKKTRQSERKKYAFDVITTDVLPEKVVLVPGKGGVTEADIMQLHKEDSAEVELNLKAINPAYSLKKPELRKLRQEKREYGEKWAEEFEEKHGGRPHKKDIQAAIDDEFPKNWTCSLDEMLSTAEECQIENDKSMLLACYDSYQLEQENDYRDASDRLEEIVAQLSERQKHIYQMVLINEETKVSAAKAIGISDVLVGREVKRIIKKIREDEILKKFFRGVRK